MEKKEQTERNPKVNHGIHPSYRISRDTLCYSALNFIISMKCHYFVAFVHITMCSRTILSNILYGKERAVR